MIEYLYTLDYQVEDVVDFAAEETTEQGTSPEGFSGDVQGNAIVETHEPASASASTYDPLLFHILMYALADRLFIHGLKFLSKQNVEKELVRRLDAASYPLAILEIYNTTPKQERGLRDLALIITMDHMTELRTGEETTPVAFDNSLLDKVPEFSKDLLVAIMNKCVADWKLDGICRKNWYWAPRSPRLF
jgi:hypothetical protein